MSRPKQLLFEVCANSIQSALNAQQGGAHRVEICQNLEVGGITPSYGLIQVVRQSLTIPVHVLIRPRGGNFIYNAQELAVMISDVQACRDLGVDGVVVGILDSKGGIDVEKMAKVVRAASPLQVTFHRAFDEVADRAEALERIVSLGCSRILTVGGPYPSVGSNADSIAELVKLAGERIIIMPGGGLVVADLPDLVRISGAIEYHGSARGAKRNGSGDEETEEKLVEDIVTTLSNLSTGSGE